MKLISTLAVALSGLALLAGSSAAQGAPVPRISEIPARKSWSPGNLVVLGSNLGLTSGVSLDDVPVPILRTTGFRLVAGPLSARDPGFGAVELFHGAGVTTGVAEFVPTLTASQRGLRVEVRLNNGEAGTYVLRYAFGAIAPEFDPGIYGPRFLPATSSVFSTGVFPDENPLIVSGLRVPIEVGLIGVPLRLQATCYAATSNTTAHSNLAVVPGFGRPKGN
jgi:hypothetical protein